MLPVIVMPTYNERENIEKMVREILVLDCGISVMIIDDNSPDGTGDIADSLAREFPGAVHVRHRPGKEGLGPAYRYGFSEALALGADVILQMDADFSHDPSYLPRFLAEIGDHDIIIGSRYVEGGGTRNWSTVRKLISRGGSAYARLCTGMKIKDTTSGFRCYKRAALESIDFDRLSAAGYAFQVELSYVSTLKGFDIMELPIIFTDRQAGQSKMGFGIVSEAMVMVALLRWRYRDLRKLEAG